MKISESWLREWVNPDLESEALAHQLTMLGLEVDSVSPAAGALDNVVVGRVLATEPHPDADRLTLCQVDIGQDEALAIVCGAANVRGGGSYPVALVGAVLPGGLKISKSKIRGQASYGMLCSTVELGLAENAEGILEISAEHQPGTPICAALDLDDHIIDIDLTPNRADCFSVLGVARDLAAATNSALRAIPDSAIKASIDAEFPVQIEDEAGCPRFVGRVLRDLDPHAVTPIWMQERLRRSGIRSRHPVVDVTNYVMLEYGQPMHAYDLDRLRTNIIVRRASRGESMKLLDAQSAPLDADILVIADASGPIGVAGIMGGESTAVGDGTQQIFLESAYFSPAVMAGRARRLGLHTDASMRFERGVDPMNQVRAIERATRLILDIAGGSAGPVTDVCANAHLPERTPVLLRRERLRQVLGCEIPDRDVESILRCLNFAVDPGDGGWIATPPSARFDINLEVDLIEEVARLFGYDRITDRRGVIPVILGQSTESGLAIERMRSVLVDRGYYEAMTYSFIDERVESVFQPKTAGLKLSNPISAEMAVMRQSLWPGLVMALQYNLNRQQSRVRLFESGVRFFTQDADILEEEVLAGVAIGSVEEEQWDGAGRSTNLFDIKADLHGIFGLTGAAADIEYQAADHPSLRPGRTAKVLRSGRKIGWIGELHPTAVTALGFSAAPMMFELSLAGVLAARPPGFGGVSKFPAVRRDIAVVIDKDLPVAEVERAVRESAGTVLRETLIFDVYVGSNVETGSKSVALGLILQDTSRTLNDDDVDRVMRAVNDRLSRDFNATIRE